MKRVLTDCVAAAAVLAFVLALALTGCKKSDNAPTGPSTSAASEGDAGNIIAGALGSGSSTGGMAAQVSEAAKIASGQPLPSLPALNALVVDSLPHDTVVVRGFAGALRQYSYTFNYNWQFSNGYTSLDFGYTMNGDYSTPVIDGHDTAQADYQITKIGDRDSVYAYTGTYTRLGIETLLSNDSSKLYTLTTITFKGLNIGKASGTFVNGGIANVTVGGYSASTGAGFSYTALVTFLGNGQARMVIGTKTFLIDLNTGTSTPS